MKEKERKKASNTSDTQLIHGSKGRDLASSSSE